VYPVTSSTEPKASAPAQNRAKKPDYITLPMVSVLAAVVIGALGHSKDSALLTWQVPLALVVAACAWVGVRAARAKG
jgi:hypothetical protein